MLLTVETAAIEPPAIEFSFVVPGHQIWKPRSFRAIATRGVGGTPDRAYSLTITDGTNTVAAVGAEDAGSEPGTCSITWCDMPAAKSASGGNGIVVAPLGPFVLYPGYVITGTIVGGATDDTWFSALCWFDYEYSDA